MNSIREILRRLLQGPRYERYWRDLRSYERDPRSRYTPVKDEGRRNGQQRAK